MQVLIVLSLGPDKAKEFLGIELPGGINIWPSVRDTRLLDRSDFHNSFIYSILVSFYSIPLFFIISNIQKDRRKSWSVSDKIGQVPTETKFWDTLVCSHIPLVFLIIPYRPLTSSFPWPFTPVAGAGYHTLWAQQRFTVTNALLGI